MASAVSESIGEAPLKTPERARTQSEGGGGEGNRYPQLRAGQGVLGKELSPGLDKRRQGVEKVEGLQTVRHPVQRVEDGRHVEPEVQEDLRQVLQVAEEHVERGHKQNDPH